MKKAMTIKLLIAGMEIRTSNDTRKAEKEISQLWGCFVQVDIF
jgi:predicted transcriptional regulator YdeE